MLSSQMVFQFPAAFKQFKPPFCWTSRRFVYEWDSNSSLPGWLNKGCQAFHLLGTVIRSRVSICDSNLTLKTKQKRDWNLYKMGINSHIEEKLTRFMNCPKEILNVGVKNQSWTDLQNTNLYKSDATLSLWEKFHLNSTELSSLAWWER